MPEIHRSVLQEVQWAPLKAAGARLFIKRDDLIDEEISGNKWRKLKYYIAQIDHRRNDGLITFGGAYSNHLLASAAAAHKLGLKSIGIVRGEELGPQSNEILIRCSELGMELHFASREEYALKNEKAYLEDLALRFPNKLIIPEGGAGYYGMLGCQEILPEIRDKVSFDRIFVAQGTTTTSCGLALALRENERLDVIPVLKGFDSLGTMRELLGYAAFEPEFVNELMAKVTVHGGFHFDGYAKVTEELIGFIRSFYAETGLKLDPVYTAKTMFALKELLEKGGLDGETIVFLHTGGLQGAAPVERQFGNLYPAS